MRIFEFLRRESTQSWTPVFILTILSGAANGIILAIINAGASAVESNTLTFRLLLLFFVAMAIFVFAKRMSLSRTVEMVERMVRTLRLRICDRIRHSELIFIEKLGKGELFTTIAQDPNMISQSAFVITNAAQDTIMLAAGLLYITYLSPAAFLVIAACIAAAMLFFQRHQETLMAELGALAVTEGEFVETLNHIIDGFKEVRLNSQKNQALYESFENIAMRTESLKSQTGITLVTNVMFSRVFFYVLMALVIFVLPKFVKSAQGVVMQLTSAVLFVMAPLEMIIGAIPVVARSSVALTRLYALESQLEAHLTVVRNESLASERFRDFHIVTLNDACFTYRDETGGPGFTVGPLDITIERGKILFIVGGNGSGKSTLLKMLTGLYPVSSGGLHVDKMAIAAADLPAYRELIAAIFTDFHLFDRLYGLEDVDVNEVRKLILEMELEYKTDFQNGRFTNVSLSTGQRKRLAMITAILENREIYIFDEWAADQDVHFRERFYTYILPKLRDSGKAVIAVTHDDRYWSMADRVVKLEAGVITEDSHPESKSGRIRKNPRFEP